MKIGLALGGGFARGFAHIGVLKVLEKKKIPIHYISGSSAGAIIGAFYAAGYKAKEIEKIALDTDWKSLIDLDNPEEGIVKGDKLEEFIKNTLKKRTFHSLKKPLFITSVNLNKGKEVIFDKGDLIEAIRASISYPGIFSPVKIKNSYFVDGGILDPIPSDILRKVGADKIIAVDLHTKVRYFNLKKKNKEDDFFGELKDTFVDMGIDNFRSYLRDKNIETPLLLDYLLDSNGFKVFLKNLSASHLVKILMESVYLMEQELIDIKLKQAKIDVVIKPNLSDIGMIDFEKIKYCIEGGEIAANNAFRNIRHFLH